MRPLIRRSLFALVATVLLFSTFVGVLALRTADPRPAPAWERLADMPQPRGEIAAAVGARVVDDGCEPLDPDCGGIVRVIVSGGITGAGRTVTTVSVYDPEGDRWTSGPGLPQPRHHVGSAAIGGVVYVSGGAASATAWKPETNLWSLAPDSTSWERLPSMPQGRMAHQMVAVGNRLYVIGGRGGADVLIFDVGTQAWETGAPIPQPRDHLAVVAAGTDVWAIGGRDDDLTTRVDIYDTATDRWRDGPALPKAMSAMAAGLLPDGIHIVGGEDPRTIPGGVIDQHHVLALGSTKWEPAPLPTIPTHGSAGVVVSDSLLVAGGSRRQAAFSPLGWTGLLERYSP